MSEQVPASKLRAPQFVSWGAGIISTLQANEATPRTFEMPYSDGEMLSFVAFDLEKRVKALRDGLECA